MKICTLSFILVSQLFLGQNIISISGKNIDRGVIYKTDKTLMEGKITTPLSAFQKQIKVRNSGKNLKIKSEEIDSIVFDSDKNTIIFSATEFFPKRKSTEKKLNRPQWLQKITSGKMELYQTTYIEHRKENDKSTTLYFLKRKNEKFPTLIGAKINEPFPQSGERDFKNNIEKYFSDEPNFLNLIKEKEFSLSEIRLICKEYNR